MSLGRKEDPFAGTILFSHIPFLRHISVNACLMPVLAADGCHVTTVEGVGTVKGDNLHPIQKAMVDMHGSQCGKYKKKRRILLYFIITQSNKFRWQDSVRLESSFLYTLSLPTTPRCHTSRSIWMEICAVVQAIDPFGMQLGLYVKILALFEVHVELHVEIAPSEKNVNKIATSRTKLQRRVPSKWFVRPPRIK